jgi:hypothetical protein
VEVAKGVRSTGGGVDEAGWGEQADIPRKMKVESRKWKAESGERCMGRL